jgi:hypothetical protein
MNKELAKAIMEVYEDFQWSVENDCLDGYDFYDEQESDEYIDKYVAIPVDGYDLEVELMLLTNKEENTTDVCSLIYLTDGKTPVDYEIEDIEYFATYGQFNNGGRG